MTTKAILFDLDDTLVVEVAAAEAAFIAASGLGQDRYGIDPRHLATAVREQARPLWHAAPAREYCLRIGISSWEGLWAAYRGDDPDLRVLRDWAPTYRCTAWSAALSEFGIEDQALALALAEEFPRQRRMRHQVFPDVLDALGSLRKTMKLGLITNGLSCLQREKIEGAALAPWFDATVISGDLGIGKPDARIFRAALDRLGTDPAQTLMVGNSVRVDIGGAQAVGMKAILLDRGDPHGKDDSIKPDAVIHSLAELPTSNSCLLTPDS
jgi:putative hydrolase of the HAD superfamily